MCKAWCTPNDRLGAYMVPGMRFPVWNNCSECSIRVHVERRGDPRSQVRQESVQLAESWIFRALVVELLCGVKRWMSYQEEMCAPARDKRSACVMAGTLLN